MATDPRPWPSPDTIEPMSTVAFEKRFNPALAIASEDAFVAALTTELAQKPGGDGGDPPGEPGPGVTAGLCGKQLPRGPHRVPGRGSW
jgi:hypothetical protein